VRKRGYRGLSGRQLRNFKNLSHEEALHWLTHHALGRALVRDTGEPLDKLADYLVMASGGTIDEKPADVGTAEELAEIVERDIDDDEDEDDGPDNIKLAPSRNNRRPQ
jgi:hypothetical protein